MTTRNFVAKVLQERIGDRPIECLAHGPRMNDQARWRCTECEHIWETIANSVLGKQQTGCPNCWSKKVGKCNLLSHDEVVEAITSRINVTILSKYKGDGKPLKARCNRCEHAWFAPATHLKRETGCPRCASKGGDGLIQIAKGTQKLANQECYLYVMRIDDKMSKVGITNNLSQRKYDHRGKFDYECSWLFSARTEAVIIEAMVLAATAHKSSPSTLKGGGSSEVRVMDADTLISECQYIVDMVENEGCIDTLRRFDLVDTFTLKNIERQLASA